VAAFGHDDDLVVAPRPIMLGATGFHLAVVDCATMCYMARAGSKPVGVRELRQNLSVHLVRVKAGHTLTVTEHGRAVAELRPVPPESDQLARLIADGRLRPPRRSPLALPRPLRLTLDRPVSALLEESREDSI
jgi:antitoxin (DNA-binding transcriptional repressor) of toxin-antitoxin stability system